MYKENSPWSRTSLIEDSILDVLKKRFIFKDPFDEEYVIPQQFDERPDLCSFELYGTAKYWWIFAQRNPDIILDPIRGFTTGTVIKIPSKVNISKMV